MAAEPSLNELIEQLKRIRIQETRVIEQIERANNREAQARRAGVNEPPPALAVGDRVRITNGLRAGLLPTGTVTRVGPRISVTTDDGTHTWRARKNLVRL